MTEPIDHFVGEYDFLSNFYPSDVWLDGECYRTVEHAYQAAKTLDPAARKRIQIRQRPGDAKRLGQSVEMRPDWDDVKRDVMGMLLRQKFSPAMGLDDRLLATGDAELIEGNWWNDRYWGVCDGEGENHLGKLLMQIRLELSGVESV